MTQENETKHDSISENAVDASPSKFFFVNMLTRDIELKDAILDLLDNCLDGVMRTLEQRNQGNPLDISNEEIPYAGFGARIEYEKDYFKIADNCGGMTKEILEKHAFRLGRSALERDKDLATVGLYGIGMKRAIFKMGRFCTVTTRHKNEAYRVTITPEWLDDDDEWKLDIEEVSTEDFEEGTTIEIKQLHDEVLSEFDTIRNTEFDNDFKMLVATHYSYIMHKGFSVNVNAEEITPKNIHLRIADNPTGKSKLAPFLYEGTIDGVNVKLSVGLYRDVPGDSEMEEMNRGKGNRSEDSGWTVICNDRVVLHNDTSHLSGWGVGNVPKYHNQFIAIAGVVRFYSNDPRKLPVTTTKRGINLNSAIYSTVNNVMREGMKIFTDFTNRWKNNNRERKFILSEARQIEPFKAFELIDQEQWRLSVKYGGKKFVPDLPVPEENADTKKKIQFLRTKEEIAILGAYLFQDPDSAPVKVGERCFDDYLKLARSNSSE